MPKLVEPEKWYFVVDCARCGEPIPFAKAPSPEEKPHPRQRPIVDLRCPQCGHISTYAPALMSVRQGPKRHDLA
jgi:DNA-directed RNA polymerase subunit RPC12/RpoP